MMSEIIEEEDEEEDHDDNDSVATDDLPDPDDSDSSSSDDDDRDIMAIPPANFEFFVEWHAEHLLEVDPLQKVLDFGTLQLFNHRTIHFQFENHGKVAMPWHLRKLDVAVKITNPDAGGVRTNADSESGDTVFVFTPMAGSLEPGAKQDVAVTFSSDMAHHHFVWDVALCTADIGYTKLVVEGISGKAALTAADHFIDFGCINVTNRKSMRLKLVNKGDVPGYFSIKRETNGGEDHESCFHFIPSQGLVSAYGELEVTVSFLPVGILVFAHA